MTAQLPRAVQAQLDKANQLAEDMVKPVELATETAVQTEEAPVETQSVQETPVTTVTTGPQPTQSEETWQHKYNVLTGKYNSEVPRMVQTIRDQKAQLDELTRTVQGLQQQQKPAEPEKTYSFVKPQEDEDYGADLLDAAARKAKEQYLPLVEQLQAKIDALTAQLGTQGQRFDNVEQVSMMNARDRFFSRLDSLSPTWEKLNTDPGFLNWLDSTDDLTGFLRRDMFNKAYGALDADRVMKFFGTYEKANGLGAQPQPNTLTPTVPMEQLQAPGKPRSNAPQPTKKTISRSEINAFYQRVRQGFYAGREAEAQRFEQEVFAAQSEGRIT